MADTLEELEADYEDCECSADIKGPLCDYCQAMEDKEVPSMAHKFESVSVQIFIPSTEEGRDYELWSLHDYRATDERTRQRGGDAENVCPDTVSEIIVEALLAKGYRLADAEALEANNPVEDVLNSIEDTAKHGFTGSIASAGKRAARRENS